jgi:transposase
MVLHSTAGSFGDPLTGKYRRTRLFVMTLVYSRKSVRLLVFRSSSQIWAELHEKAFRRLTGATRVVVLDNLREGVLTPDIYDPTLNPPLPGCAAALWRREHGEIAVRRVQGVLSLAKKYGAASVDDACAAALEMGVCEYRFVRRYLERNPQLPLSLRQVDRLIRQLTLYRDFIQDKTKENEP